MIKFHILFEVKFFHKYYEGYTSKDFEIILTPGTLAALSSFSLVYKQTPQGFVVLYKEEKQYLLEKLKEEINFVFGIKAKNKHFETFTNLKPVNSAEKYIFTNKKNISKDLNQEKLEQNQIKLHPEDFVDNNNLCFYLNYDYIMKELFGEQGVLIERDGKPLFDGMLEGWENTSGVLGYDYGSYEVKLKDSNESLQWYYLDNSLSRALGVIDIYVGGKESTDFSIVKGSEYHIRFENRSVMWNYYFVSEFGKSYQLAGLFSGKEKLSFSKPEEVTLVNGQTATKVTSIDVMPLQQRYRQKQFYVEFEEQTLDSTSKEAKKKINLPSPDVTRIKGIRDGDKETYFSEMYIYL